MEYMRVQSSYGFYASKLILILLLNQLKCIQVYLQDSIVLYQIDQFVLKMPKRQKKQKKAKSEKPNQEEYTYENRLCLKVLEQFVNHDYFPMFLQVNIKPRLLKQLQSLRSKAQAKDFTFSQFTEKIQAIFSAVSAATEHSAQFQELKAQFRQFFEEAKEFLQKRQNEGSITNQSNYLPQAQQAVSVGMESSRPSLQHRSQLIKRKEKISTDVPARPQNTVIRACQIASLGYNIRKMQSQDLQYICLTFFFDKYEGQSEKKGTYRLQLQKLGRREYLQLQSYVRSVFKKEWITYQMLAEEEDENFLIETDSD